MRDISDILLERAGRTGAGPAQVQAALAGVAGVTCVHDLHVWQVGRRGGGGGAERAALRSPNPNPNH